MAICRKCGRGLRADPFALDRVEPPQRLAQRKRQCRTDFQNGEVIPHQGGERGRRLVVGRVRLEHQARILLDHPAERARLLRHVIDDVAMIEFDARLHHDRDDAIPRIGQSGRGENLPVRLDRRARRVGRRHRNRIEFLGGAARHRHLGADHIDRRLAAGFRMGALGDRAEPRRALRHRRVRQRRRIAGAGHRAIEMDLAKARAHIVRDHHLGPLHRLVGRQVLPGVRPEMIAAEHDALHRQTGAAGNRRDKVAEVRRRHPGIAAVLIDLIGGRLDQRKRCAGAPRVAQRRLDHQRVRRADGKYPAGLACLVPADQVEDDPHASLTCSAAQRPLGVQPFALPERDVQAYLAPE